MSRAGADWLPQEVIRRKRDGGTLSSTDLRLLSDRIADGSLSDAQLAALAMAIWFRGMTPAECAALTLAMRDSGEAFDWQADALPGPVLDKHSTGGVGDLVSLLLGPMLAACGAYVPMVVGRGLGHTGGTQDKLEAIPGYRTQPDAERFRAVVREAGVAIVGPGGRLAPADRRFYAVRDVTATVDSIPLITASILSKKLAAGLDALVMDIKTGNGAVLPEPERARELGASIRDTGAAAGLPVTVLLTDMSEPLARSAGNALELREAIGILQGGAGDPRLMEVTLALGAEALRLGGLAVNDAAARAALSKSLASGAAAERFARMVAGLGGPADLLERLDHHVASAPVVVDVPAPRAGHVSAIDTRALGLAVVALGGGRSSPEQAIDPAVGLDRLAGLGATAGKGEPLARVHAASEDAAAAAVAMVGAAYRIGDSAPAPAPLIVRMDDAPAAR